MYAQLPLEVSALPMPWFSDRTHFMVISRKAQNKDLKRRESAMAELALNVVGEAASLLLHTGMSGATVALGGFNALKSAAKAAGKGDALSAFKSISNEVQKNASYVDQAAKFLFGYRRDTNWEPILCGRVSFTLHLRWRRRITMSFTCMRSEAPVGSHSTHSPTAECPFGTARTVRV